MIYRPIDNDFAEWAFGMDAWEAFLMYIIEVPDLAAAWNKLHSDLHVIDGADRIDDSLKTMKQLYKECQMDKKMHKVTEKMKDAEKDIKSGKKQAAVKVLKGAEKKNEKLVKIDKDVRDPMVEKAKKMMKNGCK
jgi:hypothetical protein